LQREGITYNNIDGNLFNGFKLNGLNYKNKIVAKEIQLKVDWSKLENRTLYIDNIVLDELYIDKDFLKYLIENSTTNGESNPFLPLNRVVINSADLTLKNIMYENYKINYASLKIRDLTTDIEKECNGSVDLIFESNITKSNLHSTIENNCTRVVGDIEINKRFLEPFIKKNNITLINNPKFTINGTKYRDKREIKYHIITNSLGIKKDRYQIKSQKLILDGNYYIGKEDIKIDFNSQLSGNMGDVKLKGNSKLNLRDFRQGFKFNINSDVKVNKKFIEPFIQDTNITLSDNPNLLITVSGNTEKINYHLTLNPLKLQKNIYIIDNHKSIIMGEYNLNSRDIYLNIDTTVKSNLVNMKLKGDSRFNLDKFDKSLYFNVKADLIPHRKFLNSTLLDKNISIKKISTINVNLKGNLNKSSFRINLKDIKAGKNNIYLALSRLNIIGNSNLLKGEVDFNLLSKFFSTLGSGTIQNNTRLNFNNPIDTLKYKGTIHIDMDPTYINKDLENKHITFIDSKINSNINGDIDRITATTNLNLNCLIDGLSSNIKLKTIPIEVNLKSNKVKGGLVINGNSPNMHFNIKSRFNGDYRDIRKIKTHTEINFKEFNRFGINLNPLLPLNLKLVNDKNGASFKIVSKRIKLNAKTSDYNKFTFNIKTGNLYLYKIIKLPQELYHKYIRLNLAGDFKLLKRYFNLNGYIYSNKKFKAKVKIKNSRVGLNGGINTAHLKLKMVGKIDKRNIKTTVHIDSIKEFQKEISKLYPINIMDIDGLIDTKFILKNKTLSAKIVSPKIKLNGFNIEGVFIGGNYADKIITITNLSLRTTGFKDQKFNRRIHLNRDGKIYLSDKRRDILIDMLPNLLIVAKGNRNKLNGRLILKKLPIAHPDYGSLFLNSNIYYKQRDEKRSITGTIYTKEMKLFYEAKFLDIDYDPDVIILTKKGKQMQKRLNNDSFLKNTYIDLKIKAPQTEYKTPDIDLIFDVNLNLNKEYGKPIALLGRVDDINGRFDQVPKRFYIKNSTIIFKGGKKINPLLDIYIEYELPQVLIKIAIGGYANRPKIEFTSEPPMPKKDIMSYLLLGVSTANLTSGEGSLGREAELFILNQAARDFAYDFDLDRLFIKDDGTGEGYIIEAGKKITKRDMVIIESFPIGNSYILEHDFSKNIKLRVGQHQKEHPSQSIDIYFRKRFK